jgi:hypothetical protein
MSTISATLENINYFAKGFLIALYRMSFYTYKKWQNDPTG